MSARENEVSDDQQAYIDLLLSVDNFLVENNLLGHSGDLKQVIAYLRSRPGEGMAGQKPRTLSEAVAAARGHADPVRDLGTMYGKELTSSDKETLEALDDAAAYFRKEAAYECENIGSGGSSIALGRWKRFYHAIENVAHDIRHPGRALPAAVAPEEQGK